MKTQEKVYSGSKIMAIDEENLKPEVDKTKSDLDRTKKQKKKMDEEQQLNQRLLRTHSDETSDDSRERAHLLEPSEPIDTGDEEDNDNNDGGEETYLVESQRSRRLKQFFEQFFYTTLLPDTVPSVGSVNCVEGEFTVKLLKFIVWTFLLIAVIHKVVPFLTDDRDQDLELWQILVFDGNLIVCDLTVFFLVGRMWRQQLGIDHLGFLLWAVLANVYFQLQPYFHFLQHSATLYEMHCKWPWKLWVFALTLIPFIAYIVFLHIIYAYKNGILVIKIMEVLLCLVFFVIPLAPSPYFHLHHWFAGWLLGMHSNFSDVWWSRALMAYCWGMYINGIAVYGRDPVLSCEYSYFLSVDQECPYLECYDGNGAEIIEESMITPDWKNCSADSYHP